VSEGLSSERRRLLRRASILFAAAIATVAAAGISVRAAASTRAHFPAPPKGAIVYSRELGQDALALGVVPQRGRVLVQASVLGSQGQGVTGMRVSFGVHDGNRKAAHACGPGCYRATLSVRGRPAGIDALVNGRRWRVTMPARWPAPSGATLMARARRAWRSLRSVSYVDRLASGPGQSVLSTWQVQAPDRIAYEVWGGGDSVVIGAKRWDLAPGGNKWVESDQLAVKQPVPFWVSVADAHVLGTARVNGTPAWQVSFFDPGTPAWFDVMIDSKTMLALNMHMITTAHFMSDSYSQFNSTPSIQPPR